MLKNYSLRMIVAFSLAPQLRDIRHTFVTTTSHGVGELLFHLHTINCIRISSRALYATFFTLQRQFNEDIAPLALNGTRTGPDRFGLLIVTNSNSSLVNQLCSIAFRRLRVAMGFPLYMQSMIPGRDMIAVILTMVE